MRDGVTRALSLVAALLLVTSALGGAATTGMLDQHDVNPVGEGRAVACGGLCIVGGVALASGIALGATGAAAFLDDSSVNKTALEQADTAESHAMIYQGAATQRQNNLVFLDTYGNYMNDARTTAKIIGKNAYIRAANNGSTKSGAVAAARGAVEDYYAARQKKLAKQYTLTAEWYWTHQSIANNLSVGVFTHGFSGESGAGSPNKIVERQVQLVNRSSVTVSTPYYTWWYSSIERDGYPTPKSKDLGAGTDVEHITVTAPNSNYESQVLMDFSQWQTVWTNVTAESNLVEKQVNDYINGTWQEYQAGEINTSDMIDPYLSAREYSPEDDYGTWAIQSIAATGAVPPENLTTTKEMVIQSPPGSGDPVRGILLSDELPQGGAFQLNTTYDSAQLNGSQLIVNGDTGETTEVTGKFEITRVISTDGSTVDTDQVEYRSIDYQTTTIEDYKQLQDSIRNLTATIEARQSNLRNSGSTGGLFPGGFGGMDIPMPVGAAIVVVLLVVLLLPVVYRT